MQGGTRSEDLFRQKKDINSKDLVVSACGVHDEKKIKEQQIYLSAERVYTAQEEIMCILLLTACKSAQKTANKSGLEAPDAETERRKEIS